MYAPFSRYPYITPVLIGLSAGLVLVHMLLSDAPTTTLWTDWAISGILSAGIWHIVARFRLDGGASVRAFAISWPLLAGALCFTSCHFSQPDQWLEGIIQQLAMLAFISLQMSLWQRHQAIIKHILVGLIIGLTSTLIPHTLLWTLLVPIAGYYMRSWSLRNMMSVLTGIVLGIWFIFLFLFFGSSMEAADAMILQYAILFVPFDFSPLFELNLWQYIFLGFIALLLVLYSFSGLAINVGQSVRAEASILLISALSLALVVLFVFDLHHVSSYIGMFSLFLGLQLTIQQANFNSAIIEWWILLILLVSALLCLFPFFFSV